MSEHCRGVRRESSYPPVKKIQELGSPKKTWSSSIHESRVPREAESFSRTGGRRTPLPPTRPKPRPDTRRSHAEHTTSQGVQQR